MKSNLALKMINGILVGKEFSFHKSSGPITIGRSTKSTIFINESTISRTQCTINFKKEKWYIEDCDGSHESLNGTWIYLTDEVKIKQNLIVRVGESVISLRLVT